MLTGGCLCGEVRYEADGAPFHKTVCHCSMCRRASGAPIVAWFSVPREELRWVQGAPKRYRSSAQATKAPSSIPSQTEAIRNNPNLPPQAKAMMMNQAQRSSR